MTFMECNRGILTFLDGGKIEAQMDGDLCGKFSFSGARAVQQRGPGGKPRKSSTQQRKEVKAWKKQWRGINWTNHEVASKARWGGWGGEDEDESAFESDTTVGHHRREHKIDLENFLDDSDSHNYEDEDGMGNSDGEGSGWDAEDVAY
jgi:hypothetical protein